MTRKQKLLQKAINNPQNFRFSDMIKLVEVFGFRFSRRQGSHQVFVHPDVSELINLQKVKGQVKPYQVTQFLNLVERYNLELEAEEGRTE